MPFPMVRVIGSAAIALLLSSCTTAPYRDFAIADAYPQVVTTATVALVEHAGRPPDDLRLLLTSITQHAGVPAMAAAVLSNGHIVAQGVVGERRRGSSTPATLDDQWEIASCAKAVSAVAIARLVEDGALAWDRPLPAYFPGEKLHADWQRVTLRRLLTHTAGIRDPIGAFLANTYFDRGTLPERRRAFALRVMRQPVEVPSSTAPVYSNTDYILAAVVAEAVTHVPWERLVRDCVFAPLGLRSAGFGPPGDPGRASQPWGHGKFRVFQLGIVGAWPFDPGSVEADYPAMASPAGYVHLSLADWETFAELQLKGDAANPHRSCALLQPETFDQLHGRLGGGDYGGGWFIGTRPWARGSRAGDTGRVLYHLGNNGRWTSAAWLAPELDFAVLIVCNAGDKQDAVDKLAGQLVSRYAGRR